MKKFIFIISFLFLLSCSFAQIPQTISYQGVLTGTDGTPVPDGMVSLTFRLYDLSENGDTLWQETQSVQVTNGIFNVILGSNSPLNLPFDKQYWMGISIGGDAELTPRTVLTASPYSLNSHSTIAETEPGQGLTIRNSNGEATHQFNPNGDVVHTGNGTFLGGIVTGDTTRHPDTSLVSDTLGANKKILSLKKISSINGDRVFRTDAYGVGGYGGGDDAGLWGESYDGDGVYGYSYDGDGVYGYSSYGHGLGGKSYGGYGIWGGSVDSYGVYGESRYKTHAGVVGNGDPGVWAQGKLKVDEVPEAPNLERFLVWDTDNIIKYRTLATSNGSFDGILQDKALVVKSGQTEVFRVNTDGTSYHKGVETFDDDVIFKGTNGGAKFVDGNGNTIAGFGRKDLDTDQKIGVYGKAQNPGDLAGAFEGDVEVNGEIAAGSFHVVSGSGDTLTSFNADGTSMHTGLETYKAGIKTTLNNGNILRIDPAEGLTIKTPSGGFIAHIRYDGAAYFAGNVSKGGGSFKIDHPLDPEHKYLYHSFVESPDMMNVYNGNVTLNNNGEALVKLPDWFEALNKDFRYQLTAIGAPGPNLYVAEKISGNRFKVAGGTEGMEVSWQVTGIRKDAYAEKHRIPVEELKKGEEIGHYLHPDAFGLPENMGITTSGEPNRLTNNDLNER